MYPILLEACLATVDLARYVYSLLGEFPRLVFLGERHENTRLVGFALDLFRHSCSTGGFFLGMEQFNSDQQLLLDMWLDGSIEWNVFLDEYGKSGEGFNLEVYRPLLEEARRCGVRIVGVMPPREKANEYARTGALPDGYRPGIEVDPYYWKPYPTVLSGLFPREGPMARIPVERLLWAQSFKDSYAADRILNVLSEGYKGGFIIMGWAHIEPRGAVPTRVKETLRMEPSRMLALGFHDREELAWVREWIHFLDIDCLIVV